MILVSGCNEPPIVPMSDEIPSDFEFSYATGATHADWGTYNFECDSEGNAHFTKEMGFDLKKTYDFKANDEDRQKVYDSVVKNDFFGLQNSYTDPSIMDGGFSNMTITADGQSKTVSVTNFDQPQFEDIALEINQIILKYVGADAYSLDELEDLENTIENNTENTTGDFIATAENCEALENRENCVNYCSANICEEEVCDTLLFDADECTECGTGCCSFCNELESCRASEGCYITWVHPSGESWQYGGCENMNLCMNSETLCDYISTSYQGFLYHSVIEENSAKATLYEEMGNTLQNTYNSECP